MRALFLLALTLTACGNYCVRQPWPGDTCIRVPEGTPGKLTVALIRAHAEWLPHPVKVTITNSNSCPHSVRFGVPLSNPEAFGVTDTVVGADGLVHRKTIVVNPVVRDCQLGLVVAHEFGHFLGLGEEDHVHDGVMVSFTPDCEDGKDVPIAIGADSRRSLREVYL